MMRASPFRYVVATGVKEAAKALADHGPSAKILAGGTDLVPNMKRRQQTPPVLVSVKRAGDLQALDAKAGQPARIGAGRTLASLASDPRFHAPTHAALGRAAASVATPHIRNAATVGGNLCLDTRCNYYDQNWEWRKAIDFCMKAPKGEAIRTRDGGTCWVVPGGDRCWAVSSTDCAPALIALDAKVTLVSAKETRSIPLASLYADDGMAYLTKRADEVLSSIEVPSLAGWTSTYWKLRRRGAFDFPVVGVAAAVKLVKGVVEEARVVLGAVTSRPVLVDSSMLVGKKLTDETIAAFAGKASVHAKPLDNTDFALGWRKRAARVYLEGALKELRGDDPSTLGPLARRAVSPLPVLG